ncbi:MAG: tripartite tricarboxylate transporter TctB family protein [Methyloligellaceae bacterium]
MTLWGERIAAILCILFALFMAYNAWDFPAAGEQFPFFSCSVIILISVLMLIRSYFQPGVFTEKYPFKISYEDLKPLIITGIVVIYVLCIFELGYYTSTLIFLIFLTIFVGVRNYKQIVLTAVILFPLMYAFFELFLQARMPRGILV